VENLKMTEPPKYYIERIQDFNQRTGLDYEPPWTGANYAVIRDDGTSLDVVTYGRDPESLAEKVEDLEKKATRHSMTVHSIRITPEMRKSLLKEGQPISEVHSPYQSAEGLDKARAA